MHCVRHSLSAPIVIGCDKICLSFAATSLHSRWRATICVKRNFVAKQMMVMVRQQFSVLNFVTELSSSIAGRRTAQTKQQQHTIHSSVTYTQQTWTNEFKKITSCSHLLGAIHLNHMPFISEQMSLCAFQMSMMCVFVYGVRPSTVSEKLKRKKNWKVKNEMNRYGINARMVDHDISSFLLGAHWMDDDNAWPDAAKINLKSTEKKGFSRATKN